ncbi:hypothetical protein WG66_006849 [Moniliophthora roreri]|nr:hypothetical protein WG66_006849 [Moniliophthora roreri]
MQELRKCYQRLQHREIQRQKERISDLVLVAFIRYASVGRTNASPSFQVPLLLLAKTIKSVDPV